MIKERSFAIVVVCYNRLEGLKRLINSLESADYLGRDDITLVFSVDHNDTNEVLNYAKEYHWPFGKKVVRTFKEKQGLKNHILQCGDLTNEYDIVALFEDDIFVSNCFFSYAYNAASYYYDEENVAGISLYAYQKNWLDWKQRFEPQKGESDVYFMKIAQSWGQVWTKRQWTSFKNWYINNLNFDNTSIDIPYNIKQWPNESSWLKYYCLYLIRTDKFFVYPYFGFSTNFSDIGNHSSCNVSDYQVELVSNKKTWIFIKFNDNEAIKYDEYMNRMGIGHVLNIDDNIFTNDLNGVSNKNLYKRYILSMESLNFKVVSSYQLCLHPIELSVINNIKGSDIFLYDSKYKNNSNNKNDKSYYKRIEYSTRWSGINRYFYNPSTKELLSELRKRVAKRFKKK